MSSDKEREWPVVKRNPTAFFQAPGVLEKSTRAVAGPLRRGTERTVGPRGAPQPGGSDFGMDRVTPRGFDPMGTSDTRAPAQEASELVSSQLRKARE
jgi:hypothetical protein